MNDMRHIGNYQVISEIGAGSFGRVYFAQHAVLTNRKVAIKLMNVTYLSLQEEQEHFLQEARILEMLKHPYILPVLDVGIHESLPYLVAEYAQGGSLRQRLKQQRIFSEHTTLTILSQVGEALHYAHQQNIIHRDIKPENILFNIEGHALLADFGLATTLSTASVKSVSNAGTPLYMSPEQFRGTISKESDQYAFACVAYELFTGHPVFVASEPVAMMYKHVHEAPTPPTQHNFMLSPHIEQALLKALSKQRQDRYPTVQAFVEALTGIATVAPDIQSPLSESFVETAPRIQSLSTPQVAFLEKTGPTPSYTPSPYEAYNPQTPLPPSLVRSRNTNPDNPFSTPFVEMTGQSYDFASDAPYLASSSQDTPLPFAYSEFIDQPPPSLPTGNSPQTTPPETSGFSKRRWLLTVAIISLLVLLIGSSVAYALTTKSSKASPLSFNKSSGTVTSQNQPGNTPSGSTQPPNTSTSTSNTGKHNQPTPTNTSGPVPSPGAIIVVSPVHQDLKKTYTITAVTGTPNPAQHQIAAQLFRVPQTGTQTATSTGTIAATTAQGIITITNTSTSSFPYTTTFQISNAGTSITVTLDQSGTVPGVDPTTGTPVQVQVNAQTVEAGTAANIPAQAISTTDSNGLTYVNSAAFAGGQDAQTILLQSDINNASNSLISSLTPTAQAQVQAQVHTNQQLIQPIQCSPSSPISQDPIGSAVTSTNVTVTVTCIGEVYTPQDALNMASSLLQHDATANPNAAYQLTGQLTTSITQNQLSNPQLGIITITVQAESMGIFQFSNAQKQQLAQLVLGQFEQNALAILRKQPGVANAAITIGNGGTTLPRNPQQITITIGS